LRVLKEPFIRPAPPEAEESLAQFVERRLGRELLDYAIDPFVAGVYAGRAEDLSVKYATRKIYNLEQRYGGLIKGAIKLARERKRAGTHFKTRLLSWPEGLETIPRRLAEALANDLHTDIAVTGIDRAAGGGWKLSWKKSGKRTELNAAPTGNSEDLIAEDIFDTVFLCLPAGGLLSLPFGSGVEDRGLESLEQIPYPPVANLCLGFRREQIKHPLNGFGFLVPSREGRRILGCLFSSTLFPGRAPEGHVLLTVFLGGARQPAEAANDLDALTATVLPELRELIGLSGEPVYRRHCFWPRAIPQYNVGFGEKLSAMNAFEAANPGLHILGQTRDGISLSYCLEAGLDAPNRLAARA
jgi:oxygen-dependent protoporphyrinogen oxidase